jgi:putative transposase
LSGGAEGEPLKKYAVKLTDDERAGLVALASKGRTSARRLKRALILLSADDGESDEATAAKVRVSSHSVARLRQRLVEEGLESALTDRPRPGKARLLNGRQEAYLIALTCSAPPEGRAQWTMKLLADRLVELKVVDSISDETVRRTLKKGTSNPGSFGNGVFQP